MKVNIGDIINKRGAVVYTRVSSKKQGDEGFSLPHQEKVCNDYCAKTGLEVIKQFGGVESAWGKVEREEFNKMLRYVRNNKDVGHIVIFSEDRMTRNFHDQLKIDEIVMDSNVMLHFANTNKIYGQDAKSNDKFNLGILGLINKKLSDDISEKTTDAMHEKAKEGWYPAFAPLGYINIKDGKNKEIAIDPERAHFIREAYELMASGDYSLSSITDILNEKGLKSRTNKPLSATTLHRILHNSMYYGEFQWGTKIYVGKHPPIISKELFDKAAAALTGNNRARYKCRRDHAFRGMIECSHCKRKLVGDEKDKSNRYIYYHCSKTRGHPYLKYLKEEEFVAQANAIIQQISIPKVLATWIQKSVDRQLGKQLKMQDKELKTLQRHLRLVEDKLKLVMDQGIVKGYDPAIVNHSINKYNQDIINIKGQIQHVTVTVSKANIRSRSIDILNLLSNIGYIFTNADKHGKADILRKLAHKYTYYYDRQSNTQKVGIVFRKPFDIFANIAKKREAEKASHYTKTDNLGKYKVMGG